MERVDITCSPALYQIADIATRNKVSLPVVIASTCCWSNNRVRTIPGIIFTSMIVQSYFISWFVKKFWLVGGKTDKEIKIKIRFFPSLELHYNIRLGHLYSNSYIHIFVKIPGWEKYKKKHLRFYSKTRMTYIQIS